MTWDGTTGATLSNITELLKTIYLPAIQEQIKDENILSAFIEVNTEDVSGKEAKIECHYGRNSGTGSRADGGALPTAGYQKYKQATVGMKYHYGSILVSGPTIAATRDERGAYARSLENEITGLVKDVSREMNRQYWGCGYGVLARWRTTGSGTSYTIQKKYTSNSAGGNGFGSTFGAKYLSENASAVPVVLGAYSSGFGPTVDATDIVVSAITEGTEYDTITVTDPSVTEAAGTFYVRPGSLRSETDATAAGYGRLECMGLRGIVTDQDLDEIAYFDGTNTGAKVNDPFQGLAVATYPWWKASVFAHPTARYAGQRNLDLIEMQRIFDKIEQKAGKNYGPDMILTTAALRREYLELCQADRRSVNEMKLDKGFTALEFNGIPLTTDDDAIDGEMYFLTMKDLKIYTMSDWEWMQKDGAILARVDGYDAYGATLFRYAEMGATRRNSHGVYCDLAYTAT